MSVTQVATELKSKLTRKYLQLPIISHFNKASYEQKIINYKNQLPVLDTEEQEIVDTLRQNGVFTRNIDYFSIDKTTEAVNLAIKLLKSSQLIGDSVSQAVPVPLIRKYPEILLWGLDNRLLNIIENYIELPIFYLGVQIRKELPNDRSVGVRKWHLDTEDYRMIKIIIYLNDVDEQGGPFEYIPRNRSDIAVKDLRYKSGLIPDRVMHKHVPRKEWVSCIGEKYTVNLVDTARVLHRAKPPISKERLSITFNYISQYPIHFRTNDLSISTASKHLYTQISARQLQCLYTVTS